MTSWKKALAIALGLPSTILGLFILTQKLVEHDVLSQGMAQLLIIVIVLLMLLKMIKVTWKKNKKEE